MGRPVPTVFRVVREKIDGQTVRITLEPFFSQEMLSLNNGDEFITGVLSVNPWESEPS